MQPKPESTKLALIHAAGELFSEFGLRGASIRTIAEKAGANVAAVNYHFGSKENLYTEVLGYALAQIRTTAPQGWMADPNAIFTPAEAAERLRQHIYERFETLFSPDLPRWCFPFIVRSLQVRTPALRDAVNNVYEPEHEALEMLIQRVNPELRAEDAHYWAFSIMGMIAFYVFAEVPIQILLGVDNYERSFLEAAATHVTEVVFTGLGVPEFSHI